MLPTAHILSSDYPHPLKKLKLWLNFCPNILTDLPFVSDLLLQCHHLRRYLESGFILFHFVLTVDGYNKHLL